MKRGVIYIMIVFFSVGCTLSETATYTIIRRPNVAVAYNAEQVACVKGYIFDPNGTFLDSLSAVGAAVGDTIRILDGVPQVDYTLISFANGASFVHRQLEKGVSKMEDILLSMPAANNGGCDGTLYGIEKFRARRGEHKDIVTTTRPLYYNVELTVKGFADVTQPLPEFAIEFRNVPLNFNHEGRSSNAAGVFCPELTTDGDKKQCLLNLNRFTDEHKIEVHALSQGVSLGHKVILPSQIGVDPTSPDQQTIRVSLIMETVAINIYVNDWFLGTIQLASIGG